GERGTDRCLRASLRPLDIVNECPDAPRLERHEIGRRGRGLPAIARLGRRAFPWSSRASRSAVHGARKRMLDDLIQKVERQARVRETGATAPPPALVEKGLREVVGEGDGAGPGDLRDSFSHNGLESVVGDGREPHYDRVSQKGGPNGFEPF